MASNESRPNSDRVEIGVAGIDDILGGGLMAESATLVRGAPGSGKTIFGLHFLANGVDAGDSGLYINLGEPTDYIRKTARSFGLDIDPIEFLMLSPSGEQFQGDSTYTLFSSAEVEGPDSIERIREQVEADEPDRVVIDPATEFRYLTTDDHQFRSQILSLIDFLRSSGATVVLTSQAATSMPDDDLQFLVDAVVNVEEHPEYRTVRISKFRGGDAQRGRHTLGISDSGMSVWPTLDPDRYGREVTSTTLSSGIDELDTLLSGGLTSGTITLFSGPAGVGKTTMGLQFLSTMADRGHRSILYSFEEHKRTLLERADGIGIPIREQIDDGLLRIESVGQQPVNKFSSDIRSEVEDNDIDVVMIDGTTGFEQTLVGLGDDPMAPLVDIGKYLRNMGVTGLVANEVHQITGEFRATEKKISHLADTIVVLRHVEYKGELRKVVGVLKKRTSAVEPRLRELEITDTGLEVGEPLTGLRGILTGTPEWNDEST